MRLQIIAEHELIPPAPRLAERVVGRGRVRGAGARVGLGGHGGRGTRVEVRLGVGKGVVNNKLLHKGQASLFYSKVASSLVSSTS